MIHDAMNITPPIGVIAPRIPIPVVDKTNSDPANNRIPMNITIPAALNIVVPVTPFNTPSKIRPSAWYI